MSYIITNGTSYCHRTRTQAVEIVTDLDMATRFKDEEAAKKLLARATKKLGGFSVQDYAAAEAAARKPGRKRTRKSADEQTRKSQDERTGKSQDEQTRKNAGEQTAAAAPDQKKEKQARRTRQTKAASARKEEPQKDAAGTAAVKEPVITVTVHDSKTPKQSAKEAQADAPDTEAPVQDAPAAAEQKAQRNRRHRGGRRRKNNSLPEGAAETANVSADSEDIPQDTAAAQPGATEASLPEAVKVPPVTFKVEVHSVGTPSARPAAREQKAEEPAAAEPETQAAQSQRPEAPAPVQAQMPEQPVASQAQMPEQPVASQTQMNEPDDSEVSLSRTSSDGQAEKTPEKQPEPQSGKQSGRQNGRRASRDQSRTRTAGDNGRTAAEKKDRTAGHIWQEEPSDGPDYEDIFDDQPVRQTAQHGRGRSSRNEQAGAGSSRTGSRRGSQQTGSTQNASSGRRSRKSSVPEDGIDNRRRQFTVQERNLVYNRTEGHCGICGKFIPLEEYTIDHIIPLSKGGTNALDNLQACCGFCNKAKDDSLGDDFFNRIRNIFLYQAELKYGAKKIRKFKKALKDLD